MIKTNRSRPTLAWRKERKIPTAVENMEPAELSTMLKRFYVKARNVERKPRSSNTVKAIRSGLDRFLSGSPQRKPFSIIRDKVFKRASEALDASLKDLARQGLISSTKNKRPISSKDLKALYAAN